MGTLIEQIVTARERDLGGFSVRRLLPVAGHRMVGPFIFFDHMGPAVFPAGSGGIDVRPHPHIHLATVTYLFEGVIHHRDSLGSSQLIEPGAINWMTAGRGIVHSERSPEEFRIKGGSLNGLQCWVALPEEHLEVEPTFHHHPSSSLPEFEVEGARVKLLLGEAYGRRSPVRVHSKMFYLEAFLDRGQAMKFPVSGMEAAVYVIEGAIETGGQKVERFSLAIAKPGSDLQFFASENSRLMILGGENIGPREIFWNFVSTTKENIERAKIDWSQGPGSPRFPKVPGDDRDFIPLP